MSHSCYPKFTHIWLNTLQPVLLNIGCTLESLRKRKKNFCCLVPYSRPIKLESPDEAQISVFYIKSPQMTICNKVLKTTVNPLLPRCCEISASLTLRQCLQKPFYFLWSSTQVSPMLSLKVGADSLIIWVNAHSQPVHLGITPHSCSPRVFTCRNSGTGLITPSNFTKEGKLLERVGKQKSCEAVHPCK